MEISSVLIVDTDEGNPFYRFSNAGGKVWLMPVRNMQMAMNLYQPSGRNGKLVKSLFPLLHGVSLVRKVVGAEKVRCALIPELKDLLCKAFNVDSFEFSVFCGTPCVHQKTTIQLSAGKRILGYCKVTDSEEIGELFFQESMVLKQLKEQGIGGIPQCLYCGEIVKGIYIFVQDTVKTRKSEVLHEWGTLHEDFLRGMETLTKQALAFESSDYYQTLLALQSHTEWLPTSVDRLFIVKVLTEIIDKHSGKQVEYSAYHADFTPWNMFVEKNRLFVFDWEYARLTYPPRLDKYHFFTQTAIFERHWGINQFVDYINSESGKWIDKDEYTLYLMDVVSRFTLREKGQITGDMEDSFNLWFGLLQFLRK